MMDILAGCDSVITRGRKNLLLNKKRWAIILEDITYKLPRWTTQKPGDVGFGCCHDAVIRRNTLLLVDKPDWFAFGHHKRFRVYRKITFIGELTQNLLPDGCKWELKND